MPPRKTRVTTTVRAGTDIAQLNLARTAPMDQRSWPKHQGRAQGNGQRKACRPPIRTSSAVQRDRTNAATHRALDILCQNHARLTRYALRRQNPRQEPSAVVPLAGIRAGGGSTLEAKDPSLQIQTGVVQHAILARLDPEPRRWPVPVQPFRSRLVHEFGSTVRTSEQLEAGMLVQRIPSAAHPPSRQSSQFLSPPNLPASHPVSSRPSIASKSSSPALARSRSSASPEARRLRSHRDGSERRTTMRPTRSPGRRFNGLAGRSNPFSYSASTGRICSP